MPWLELTWPAVLTAVLGSNGVGSGAIRVRAPVDKMAQNALLKALLRTNLKVQCNILMMFHVQGTPISS